MPDRPMTDHQLLRIARSFRSGMLGRRASFQMCYAVAAPLEGLLRFYGLQVELIETDFYGNENFAGNHFWIRLPDGRALDPTADQFAGLGLPPIYLGEPHPEIHHCGTALKAAEAGDA